MLKAVSETYANTHFIWSLAHILMDLRTLLSGTHTHSPVVIIG